MNIVSNMPNIRLLCRLGVVLSAVAGHPIKRNQAPWLLQHEPYGNDGNGPRWSGNRGSLPNNQNRLVPTAGDTNPNPQNKLHNQASLKYDGQQFQCDSPSPGLTTQDCLYMSQIGMLGTGSNPQISNNRIWIGSEGPNIFTFVNAAQVPIILVLWHMAAPYDDQASFMNARVPAVTYSLTDPGSAIQISLANGIPGGWAAIYNRTTTLTEYGQIDNTFGEFSTGGWATIDVSRLVSMSGDPMTISVSGWGRGTGCVADMSSCVYTCDDGAGNSCGAQGTYSLLNCVGPNAVQSADEFGNPTGGCQGWSFGGNVSVVLTRDGHA